MGRLNRNSLLFDAATIATKPAWLRAQIAALQGTEPPPATTTPPDERKPAKAAKRARRAAPDRCPISDAVTEHHEAPALGTAIQGKAPGVRRVTVRFVGYRVRPLDPDNFAGSVKDLLDGIRHAGLIPGDEPWRIRLETEQEKVSSYKQERTEILITPLSKKVWSKLGLGQMPNEFPCYTVTESGGVFHWANTEQWNDNIPTPGWNVAWMPAEPMPHAPSLLRRKKRAPKC